MPAAIRLSTGEHLGNVCSTDNWSDGLSKVTTIGRHFRFLSRINVVRSEDELQEVRNGKSDVWMTVRRNSVWIRKTI